MIEKTKQDLFDRLGYMTEIDSYAFIKDGVVFNVAVFVKDSPYAFIEDFCFNAGGDTVIRCEDYGDVGINYTWHGDHFRPPQPYPSWSWNVDKWEPPVPMPTDAVYSWDEETTSWKFVERFLTNEELEAMAKQEQS